MEPWEQIRLNAEIGARMLVAEYGDRLLGAAMLLCHDSNAAEDLVFRTFERAIEKIRLYDSSFPFWNWLYAILLNYFRMDMRKRKAFVPESESFVVDALEAGSCDSFSMQLAEADAAMIRAAVGRLPSPFRETIVLRYFEDKTLSEMSELMETPVGTVKWRLHQARNELERMLSSLFTDRGGGTK